MAHFFCGGLWINIYDFITLSMSMSDCGRKLRRTIGLQREGKLNANLILPRLVWTSNGLLKAVYYNTWLSKYPGFGIEPYGIPFTYRTGSCGLTEKDQ